MRSSILVLTSMFTMFLRTLEYSSFSENNINTHAPAHIYYNLGKAAPEEFEQHDCRSVGAVIGLSDNPTFALLNRNNVCSSVNPFSDVLRGGGDDSLRPIPIISTGAFIKDQTNVPQEPMLRESDISHAVVQNDVEILADEQKQRKISQVLTCQYPGNQSI